MRIVAIDPGLYAFCAFYQPTASFKSGLRWQFLDIPIVEHKGGARPDTRVLRDALMRFSPDRAFIELVNSMPGEGAKAGTSFMRSVGYIEATVFNLDIPITYVHPAVWKRHHEIAPPAKFDPAGRRRTASQKKTIAKRMSVKLARALLPEIAATQFAQAQSHGFAESALMALYGAHCLAPISAT